MTFCGVREKGVVLGVGALRQIDTGHAEIKSMHTALAARGRGVGLAMLQHLVQMARNRGCARVSLETGTMPAFDPARRLYERFGFAICEPFADYTDNDFSVCMTLAI